MWSGVRSSPLVDELTHLFSARTHSRTLHWLPASKLCVFVTRNSTTLTLPGCFSVFFCLSLLFWFVMFSSVCALFCLVLRPCLWWIKIAIINRLRERINGICPCLCCHSLIRVAARQPHIILQWSRFVPLLYTVDQTIDCHIFFMALA